VALRYWCSHDFTFCRQGGLRPRLRTLWGDCLRAIGYHHTRERKIHRPQSPLCFRMYFNFGDAVHLHRLQRIVPHHLRPSLCQCHWIVHFPVALPSYGNGLCHHRCLLRVGGRHLGSSIAHRPGSYRLSPYRQFQSHARTRLPRWLLGLYLWILYRLVVGWINRRGHCHDGRCAVRLGNGIFPSAWFAFQEGEQANERIKKNQRSSTQIELNLTFSSSQCLRFRTLQNCNDTPNHFLISFCGHDFILLTHLLVVLCMDLIQIFAGMFFRMAEDGLLKCEVLATNSQGSDTKTPRGKSVLFIFCHFHASSKCLKSNSILLQNRNSNLSSFAFVYVLNKA
jgi:hypothetical protein